MDNLRGLGGMGGGAGVCIRRRLGAGVVVRIVGSAGVYGRTDGVWERTDGVWDLARGAGVWDLSGAGVWDRDRGGGAGVYVREGEGVAGVDGREDIEADL